MVDETNPDKVVDLLSSAEVDVTKGVSIAEGVYKTTNIKEEFVKDGEVIFTQEETTPSEKVLRFIRNFAQNYRVTNQQTYCLN